MDNSSKTQIINADCLDYLKTLSENSVDAIVTDGPYGLSFMGKKWDYDVPSVEIWQECLRVLKPGGYLLAFAGTRTQHRMAVRIEDAGFEIRDMIAWVYGSGFPKSLDISKAIDKGDGYWRGRAGAVESGNGSMSGGNYERTPKGKPVTEAAKQWEGWGTALKPALEPITVARKPIEGTVAENCLKWGVGGINIDGSRVEAPNEDTGRNNKTAVADTDTVGNWGMKAFNSTGRVGQGRFPANLIHDGSEEVLELFPETVSKWGKDTKSGKTLFGTDKLGNQGGSDKYLGDSGSAARFFYCAKASKSERNMGLDGFEERKTIYANGTNLHKNGDGTPRNTSSSLKNFHPTVKPIKLMEYLVNIVSKEGHTVLDPFAGSGTTGIACKKLNRNFIGIERDEEYCKIATARIESVSQNNTLFV